MNSSLKKTLLQPSSPIKIYAPRNRAERRQKTALVKKGYTLTTEEEGIDMNTASTTVGAEVAEVAEVTETTEVTEALETTEVTEATEVTAKPFMVQVTLTEAEYIAVQKAIHSALPKITAPAIGRVAQAVVTAPFRALAFTGGFIVRTAVAAAVGSGIGQAAKNGFGK